VIERLAKWEAAAILAWGMRGGITHDEAAEIAARHYPYKDQAWRDEVLERARQRNRRRLMRRLSA
jgi:hypothetical protein